MRNYKFNIAKWVLPLIPKRLRQPNTTALISLLVEPLQTLINSFDDWANKVFYKAKFNGQVIMLEHLLNDTFDNTLRRITITDGETQIVPALRNRSENRPTMILRYRNEDGDKNFIRQRAYSKPNFIVHKNGATIEQNRAVALINQYKITGKTFTII